ncbi:alpha/beta hydrolase [Nocardioides sp. TRM66260-LWL]|uniref:alpha/beta hydrolase n=1 Tax=Nocardioides sp. TRM66260-LWL TaxID=2874478 RepID=UPI001CC4CB6A|nr:alpha/beta hydrolase [Nocardioides sp. TRM66260-LWL]MBZ5734693.1 alpha/beta hydrolase [Nocardioides sp. TRM66260-LWL]
MSRSTRIIALVVVAALVVGGAAVGLVAAFTGTGMDLPGRDERAIAPTTRPQPGSGTPPSAALKRFYGQTLAWAPCDGRFGAQEGSDQECAELTVPVDYRRPAGATTRIAVLRVPASDPARRIGSLVVNPGGPGAPGTGYAATADLAFRPDLRQRYDIVGFDPRGTGASDPVDCLDDRQLDAFLSADPDPDTAQEATAAVRSYRHFFTGCLQRSDALVRHVTTVETARDVDVLRSALGESRLTYFGASYGTKLGATYADLFPTRVGRLVLDGAVDVSLGPLELGLGQAGGFETALRAYVADCVKSATCPIGRTVPEGLARIRTLILDADAKPLTSDSDRPVTEGLAFLGLITPLYNRDYWPLLTQSLALAVTGDGRALQRLADVYSSRNPDGTYADNSAEAILAINCLDDPRSYDPAQIRALTPRFEQASPTLGRIFAWSLLSCRGVQTKATERDDSITAKGAAPILVVGTTRDPATPYAWAVSLARQLESGVLLTRDGDGHTGYNAGNACVDSTVEAYLIDGTVPKDGKRC